jgi:hypothetical protein
LSAVVVPELESLACISAFELTCCSVTNVCKMDNHPHARRPHKSPAHTVKDQGDRPQRLSRNPVRFRWGEPPIVARLLLPSTPCRVSSSASPGWWPKPFRPREPHILARLSLPSTPCVGVDFSLSCRRGPEAVSVRGAAHLSAVSKNVNTL